MQFGSQVRPELGRTDYTAFLQGANQGSAAMGRGIEGLMQGAAIGLKQYYEKKEEKQLFDQTRNRATEFIKQYPQFAQRVGVTDPKDPKAIDAMINGIGGGDKRRGAMMVNQAISEFAEQQRQMEEMQKEQAAMMQGFDYFKKTDDPAGAVDAAMKAGLKNPQPMVNFINAYAQVIGNSNRSRVDPLAAQKTQAEINKINAETAAIQAKPLGGSPRPLTELEQFTLDKGKRDEVEKTAEKTDKYIKQAQTMRSDLSRQKELLQQASGLIAGKKAGGVVEGLPIVKGVMSAFGAPETKILDSVYDSLRAQETLKNMRELKLASPTGATGFGNMSDREGTVLQDSFTKFDVSLPEQEQAQRIKDAMDRIDRLMGALDSDLSKVTGEPAKVPPGWKIIE